MSLYAQASKHPPKKVDWIWSILLLAKFSSRGFRRAMRWLIWFQNWRAGVRLFRVSEMWWVDIGRIAPQGRSLPSIHTPIYGHLSTGGTLDCRSGGQFDPGSPDFHMDLKVLFNLRLGPMLICWSLYSRRCVYRLPPPSGCPIFWNIFFRDPSD